MLTKFKYLVLTMLVGFALHISTQSVRAQGAIIVLSQSTCQSEFDGFWDGAQSTCFVGDMRLAAGTILEIPEDTSLTNNASTFHNDGAIYNYGTFISTSAPGTTNNNGLIVNEGLLPVGAATFNNHGTLINNGRVINSGNGTIINFAVINNFGTFRNQAGTIDNRNGGAIYNLRSGHLSGIINNTVTGNHPESRATILNSGVINHNGVFNNSGLIDNVSGTIAINEEGSVSNSGTINNSGTIRGSCSVDFSGNPPVGNSITPDLCPVLTLTWDGGGSGNQWSDPANWSPDIVPRAQDAVQFSSISSKDVQLDLDVNVTSMFIGVGFGGTISLSNHTLTVNGDFTQRGGTTNLESGTLVVAGSLNILSTDTVEPGTGKVVMNPNGNQLLSVPTLHDLDIGDASAGQGGTGTVTLGQPLTVNGNLVLNGHLLDVDAANSHDLTVNGNFLANGGEFAAQNGTVFFSGDSGQTIDATGITFNNVVFQNTSQGLVGYWPLDEQDFFVAQPEGGPTAFTTPDETANGTTGQGEGATQIAGSPVSDNALHFNGTNHRVVLGNPGVLNFAGEVSLAAWIRPEVTEGTQSILAHGYVTSPQGEVALRIVNGNYQISSWDGVRHAATAPIPAEDVNNWVHLAGTYDGTTWRLYRNGVEIATQQDATGAVLVNGGWAIGGRANGNDRFFQGGIDEVRIYNLALTPAAIARLVEGPPTVRAAGVNEAPQDEASTTAGRVQLLSPLHVAGNMMLEEGVLDVSENNHMVMLGGNLVQRGGQLNARSGALHFNGAAGTTQNIEGVQMTLADVEIGADVTVSTNAAMMRTGELNSQGQIQETRQIDGEGELHYGLSDITFNVTDATDFSTLAVTRVDMHSANAAVTTETGSHWFMDAEGEQYVVDMTLPHNNVNGPGVCQHLGNGEWDYFVDEVTEASVTRHDVTALDGEWAVGMTLREPGDTGNIQLFLPLVQS